MKVTIEVIGKKPPNGRASYEMDIDTLPRTGETVLIDGYEYQVTGIEHVLARNDIYLKVAR